MNIFYINNINNKYNIHTFFIRFGHIMNFIFFLNPIKKIMVFSINIVFSLYICFLIFITQNFSLVIDNLCFKTT